MKQQPTIYVSFLSIFLLGSFLGFFLFLLIAYQTARMAHAANVVSKNSVEDEYDEKPKFKDTPRITSDIILNGDRNKREIALTFDAEMTQGMRTYALTGHTSYDQRIIDTLANTKTKATIFMTGMWVELYPDEARKIAKNPLFEIESHSYADTSFNGGCFGLREIADSQDLPDIQKTQQIFQNTFGFTAKYFRFPGGCYDKTDIDIVTKQAKLAIVHWDVAADDGFNQNTNAILQTVINHVQNGSIIVMHLNGAPTAPKTADALPQIIQQLKAKGYTFVKVSELLGQ